MRAASIYSLVKIALIIQENEKTLHEDYKYLIRPGR